MIYKIALYLTDLCDILVLDEVAVMQVYFLLTLPPPITRATLRIHVVADVVSEIS